MLPIQEVSGQDEAGLGKEEQRGAELGTATTPDIWWGRKCMSISHGCVDRAEERAGWRLCPKRPPRCNDPNEESTRGEAGTQPASRDDLCLTVIAAGRTPMIKVSKHPWDTQERKSQA